MTESTNQLTYTQFALNALSPLDGRYSSQLNEVSQIFSEFSLIKHRLLIEVEYLIFISQQRLIPKITSKEQEKLRQLVADFTVQQAEQVKAHEAKTKHDVKAVEYFLRDFLLEVHSPLASYVHLGLTSEDTNSLSYSLMLKTAQQKIIVPHLQMILKQLAKLAKQYLAVPMLARTHGQVAVPTTVGKEFVNFAVRLLTEVQILESLQIESKLNGAVGNYNAQLVALPANSSDWEDLSSNFISSLGLQPNLFTTQILPAESYTRFFSSVVRINSILLDLNQDIWRYISDGYFIQKAETEQVGSSTMPHKINPIDFENSEGNLGMANTLLNHFIAKLPISRLQRDLSDSTVKRSWGTALGFCKLSYTSLLKGLSKISVNETKLRDDLDQHWEVLTEAFQVLLRTQGDLNGYEKLRVLSQNKQLTKKDLHAFIATIDQPEKVKETLRQLRPETYLGLAPQLTNRGIMLVTTYLREGAL